MELISGKILKLNHWPAGKQINLAKTAAAKLARQGLRREDILARLDAVRSHPNDHLADPLFGELAREILRSTPKKEAIPSELRSTPLAYPIWGKEGIDAGSLAQMDAAMSLPVTVTGALMPDAHVGYGLPIGGSGHRQRRHPVCGRGRYCLPHASIHLLRVSAVARAKTDPSRAGAVGSNRLRRGRGMAGQAARRTCGSG